MTAVRSLRWRHPVIALDIHMQARLKFALSTLVCALVCDMAQADPEGGPQPSIPVTIHIDAAQSLGPLRPIWRFFGADEPNYATMKDGEKLLGELGKLRPGE